ncbi:MAG: peptidylprolyl isomerase, partial [Planctomycetota bacterium]|nr:peptidylprolyl isomerase [Planctomycetota bacterium]
SKLVALLESPDNGVRVAAATALATQPKPGDLSALEAAFHTAVGDVGVDVQLQVLQTAKAIGTSEALSFITEAQGHAHPWVRRAARDLAADIPGWPTRPTGLDGVPLQAEPELPLDPEDRPRRNPTVVVHTSKGDLIFELFPAEAPVHVHSFLALAQRGHYDGLDFHRVVPDFVVQGGCYRGDGNGTGTWRGQDDSLRHEINRRPYVRGSLGMPRSAEMDSGGSQIFVTHLPTPHLDGRYTIFGELREGFEVLDAIVVGDRILGVEQR